MEGIKKQRGGWRCSLARFWHKRNQQFGVWKQGKFCFFGNETGPRRRQSQTQTRREEEWRRGKQAACKMKRRSWRVGGKNVGVYRSMGIGWRDGDGDGDGTDGDASEHSQYTSKTRPRHVRGVGPEKRLPACICIALFASHNDYFFPEP